MIWHLAPFVINVKVHMHLCILFQVILLVVTAEFPVAFVKTTQLANIVLKAHILPIINVFFVLIYAMLVVVVLIVTTVLELIIFSLKSI